MAVAAYPQNPEIQTAAESDQEANCTWVALELDTADSALSGTPGSSGDDLVQEPNGHPYRPLYQAAETAEGEPWEHRDRAHGHAEEPPQSPWVVGQPRRRRGGRLPSSRERSVEAGGGGEQIEPPGSNPKFRARRRESLS